MGSGWNEVISSCTTMFLLLWQQKPWNKFCHDMFYAKILHPNLRLWFLDSQISFWCSHCQMLIFVDYSPYTFNILGSSVCCRPSRMWIIFSRFSTIFEAFVPHFYLYCSHCIIPESLLYHPNTFHGGILKLNTKFDAA